MTSFLGVEGACPSFPHFVRSICTQLRGGGGAWCAEGGARMGFRVLATACALQLHLPRSPRSCPCLHLPAAATNAPAAPALTPRSCTELHHFVVWAGDQTANALMTGSDRLTMGHFD